MDYRYIIPHTDVKKSICCFSVTVKENGLKVFGSDHTKLRKLKENLMLIAIINN